MSARRRQRDIRYRKGGSWLRLYQHDVRVEMAWNALLLLLTDDFLFNKCVGLPEQEQQGRKRDVEDKTSEGPQGS